MALCGLSLQQFSGSYKMLQVAKITEQQMQLGLTLPKFRKKHVFSGEESVDAFYYDRCTPSPSQLLGLPPSEELKIKNLGCLMIVQAGIYLRLPITTTISAQTIFHYFFQRVSLLEYDFRDVAMGCVFLAAQCEQTIRRSAHVALVFDQIFKIHEKSRRPARVADIQSQEFKAIQSKIIEMEKTILIELGFEVHRIIQTPHRYMNSILQIFSKHPQIERIARMSWGYLNDSYRTSVCLYYPGQIIVISCIFLALRKLDLGIGQSPWWCLFESSLEIMENISVDILDLYENRADYYGVQDILVRFGERNSSRSGFLVPYYKKITNEAAMLVMKKSEPSPGKEQKASRERTREEKHKHKHKHKHKDRERRRKSRRDESGSSSSQQKSSQNSSSNEKRQRHKAKQKPSQATSSKPQEKQGRKQQQCNKNAATATIKQKIKYLLEQKIDQRRQKEQQGTEKKSAQKSQQKQKEKSGTGEHNIFVDVSVLSSLRKKFLQNSQNSEGVKEEGEQAGVDKFQ